MSSRPAIRTGSPGRRAMRRRRAASPSSPIAIRIWSRSPASPRVADSARARRGLPSAMRATSIPASTSCSRRAAAWPRISPTGESHASPASRSASIRPPSIRRDATRPGVSATAIRRRRACSSTPAASPPRSTSTSSSMRCVASVRPTRCSRSAPGRRLRLPPTASRCCPSSPRRPSSRPRWRAPMPSSTPATRRPSACRCSRRWRAARRRCVRAAEGLAELVDETTGSAVGGASGADFAAAIAALFDGDSDATARRSAAARRRAEAGDWQRVLPGFVTHYLRLIGEPGGAAHELERRDDAAGAYSR